MFKNREFRVRVVKPEPHADTVEPTPSIDPERIEKIFERQMKNAVMATVVVMGAAAIFSTTSQIAVNKATRNR